MTLPQYFLKLLLALVIILMLGLAFYSIPTEFYSLEYIQSQHQALQDYYQQYPNLSALIYFGLYIMVTALSLPLATVLSVLGGAIFGFLFSSILVLFAASIGASLAFLSARFILRDSLEQRFSTQLDRINQGIQKQGYLYLFSLRLLPLIPFFVVNLLFGLTKMPVRYFFMISFIGMLPAILVYVNAGSQLGQLRSFADIMSLPLFLSLILLALLPWLLRKVFEHFLSPK